VYVTGRVVDTRTPGIEGGARERERERELSGPVGKVKVTEMSDVSFGSRGNTKDSKYSFVRFITL
jgi:hypothetical protein